MKSSRESSAVGIPVLQGREDVKLECTEEQVRGGDHYELAMGRARDLGYEPLAAFDENHPAGAKLQSLMHFEGWRKQQPRQIQGDPDMPLWSVPLTVDMTLSAKILARGADAREAEERARHFAASPDAYGMFSLDEGNYRGASDFYCGDPSGIERVDGPASAVDESASGVIAFVVYSPNEFLNSEGAGFWSNDDGWTTFDGATRFSAKEAGLFGLPQSVGRDARWMLESEALTIEAPEMLACQPSDVVKTVIEVTVLHHKDVEMHRFSLAQIGNEIDEGEFLGTYAVKSVSPVSKAALRDEQLALGNDGTFFEDPLDEEGEIADDGTSAGQPSRPKGA